MSFRAHPFQWPSLPLAVRLLWVGGVGTLVLGWHGTIASIEVNSRATRPGSPGEIQDQGAAIDMESRPLRLTHDRICSAYDENVLKLSWVSFREVIRSLQSNLNVWYSPQPASPHLHITDDLNQEIY
jgi:hypothetical protein